MQINETLTVTVCLIDWMNAYLDFSKEKYVSKTYDEKVFAFNQLLNHHRFKSSMTVDTITPLFVLDHLQQQEKIRTGNASNKDRKNLAAGWSWGIRFMNMPRENPFALVEKRGEKRHPRHIPSLSDFWKVYKVTKTDQDKCMLLCYLHSGARREELFRLRWVDVDFFSVRIRLFWKKNRLGTWKETWLDMSNDMKSALLLQQDYTGNEKFVFLRREGIPYLKRQHWLKLLCVQAKVEQFGFHGIRHLTASLLAENGVPLVEIQNHLRHEHLSTTERYIHRLQNNRVAVDSLPGLNSAFDNQTRIRPVLSKSDVL